MTSEYRAVLLDMDGLMLDSERIYYLAQQEAADRLGYVAGDDLMLSFVGLSVEECERRMQEAAGDGFQIDAYRGLWRQLWREQIKQNGIPLKDGLQPVLEWLHQEGIPRAVVTSTFAEDAELSLRAAGIRGYFGHVVTGDQVERSKPAPDIYLLAARKIGVPPEQCVALEDSDAGVMSAAAAQMRVVLVPDLRQPTNEARAAAHAEYPSLTEALPPLQSWMSAV